MKAVNGKAKKLGLTKDGQFDKAIQEVACIALLPNNFILKGFDYVDKKIEKSTRWNLFKNYWKKQWPKSNISVYGLKNRTDNFSETLNKSTNLLSGRRHQCIWAAIRTIKTVETEKTDELVQHEGGKMFKKQEKQITKDLDKQITDAWLLFEETEDVGTFLKNVSYRNDILNGEPDLIIRI